MTKKRLAQIVINSVLGLFSIYALTSISMDAVDESFRRIHPVTVLFFVFSLILISVTSFSTLLNLRILKNKKSTTIEVTRNPNYTVQFLFLFGVTVFLFFALTSPLFTTVNRDEHGREFFVIQFRTMDYSIGQDGVDLFFTVLLMVNLLAIVVNSNFVKSNNLDPMLLDTSFNRRLISSHILLGLLIISFGLVCCALQTVSLVRVVIELDNMNQEEYEAIIVWDTILTYTRPYFYWILFIIYGFWIFRDGLKLKQVIFPEKNPIMV